MTQEKFKELQELQKRVMDLELFLDTKVSAITDKNDRYMIVDAVRKRGVELMTVLRKDIPDINLYTPSLTDCGRLKI